MGQECREVKPRGERSWPSVRLPPKAAQELLRGRSKSVASQAPDLQRHKNSITPFDCPRDNLFRRSGLTVATAGTPAT
jgi:hypothetical protein